MDQVTIDALLDQLSAFAVAKEAGHPFVQMSITAAVAMLKTVVAQYVTAHPPTKV